MISLSPRADLFRFKLPKDFLPQELFEKYSLMLSKAPGVIVSPVEYLNESIVGIHLPGLTGLTMEQEQSERNNIKPSQQGAGGLGRINVEPTHTMTYTSTGNPHEKLEREFSVTFRMNQGMYNYYMLYETIFYKYCKEQDGGPIDVLFIESLDDTGRVCSRIIMRDVRIDGIDGFDVSWDKSKRETLSFNLTFKFNKIDFEFV